VRGRRRVSFLLANRRSAGRPVGSTPSASPGFANGCFAAFSAVTEGFLTTDGATGYRAAGRTSGEATPFFFKPTGLGTFMIQDREGKLLSVAGDSADVVRGTVPGPAAEWAPAPSGGGFFALRSTGNARWLAVDAATGTVDTTAGQDSRGRLRFDSRSGCLPYPEAPVGASGRAFSGVNPDGTVFGYADPHLHITADLRAGGLVLSGESFDRFGITQALGRDADVHGPDGSLDVTGNLLRSGNPAGTHDTNGWPTFAGWPVFNTYTHQQIYYTWLQRAWMAGLRLVTAQLVEDQTLCQIEPRRSHSCDETATIELELDRLHALQDYVDAQSGGVGRGWLRLVSDPGQARQVIEQGKLAVLVGVEGSDPFGCTEYLNQPQCTRADVDRGIALYRRLGISTMFIAHWIDNAFAGAALQGGSEGTFIGAMQVQQTGLPFMTSPCPEAGQGDMCNSKGLTDLGAYLVGRLMDAHMLIEVDHLSEQARLTVLQLAETRHYPLVSSHTNTGGIWTPSDLQRLYALRGFATARPATAEKLAQTILGFQRYARAGQLLGVGLGTDTGGFNSAPAPDPSATSKPLQYPFHSYDGNVQFVCQLAGTRKFDLNKVGVANYGLYADLLAYMRQQEGGEAASRLLFRSAEGYLQTWEAAMGH
jgi:microsomal dipeptidase-like Zn-dependent dipeptidase